MLIVNLSSCSDIISSTILIGSEGVEQVSPALNLNLYFLGGL